MGIVEFSLNYRWIFHHIMLVDAFWQRELKEHQKFQPYEPRKKTSYFPLYWSFNIIIIPIYLGSIIPYTL